MKKSRKKVELSEYEKQTLLLQQKSLRLTYASIAISSLFNIIMIILMIKSMG